MMAYNNLTPGPSVKRERGEGKRERKWGEVILIGNPLKKMTTT